MRNYVKQANHKAGMFLRYNTMLENNGVRPLQRSDRIFEAFFNSNEDFSAVMVRLPL